MKKYPFTLSLIIIVVYLFSCVSNAKPIDNVVDNNILSSTDEENVVSEEKSIFVYDVSDNSIIINGFTTKYQHRDKGIIIPSEINGYPVIEIGIEQCSL